MLSEVAQIYRSSKKKVDINWWTEWVCRPPAAVLVYLLKNTRVSPNQITFLSLVVAAISGAILVFLPGHAWLIVAAVVYEFSFVLDCVDGQLARIRGTPSVLGHLLDFLMDEIKALLILGCVTVRLYQSSLDELFLFAGLGATFALASGLMLTSFIRRPEYGGAQPTADGQPAVLQKRRGPVGTVLNVLEHTARLIVHYPSYIWLCAAFNRIDVYFWAYGSVNVLYLGRTFLGILIRLGRFTPKANPGSAAAPPDSPGPSGITDSDNHAAGAPGRQKPTDSLAADGPSE